MPLKPSQSICDTPSVSSGDATVSTMQSQPVHTTSCDTPADSPAHDGLPVEGGTEPKKSRSAFADSSIDWEHLSSAFLNDDTENDYLDVQRVRLHTVVSSKQDPALSVSDPSRSEGTRKSSSASLSASRYKYSACDDNGNTILHVSTRSFIAVVSCFGVLLVSLLTVLATDLWGLRDATATIHEVQSEATQTLLETMRLDLRPIDDFMVAVGSPYFTYSELPARLNMSDPAVQNRVKTALVTIMYQRLFSEHVAFIQIGEFTPYDRWRVLVVAPTNGDNLYGAVEHGFDSQPVDLRLCSPVTHTYAEPAVCLPGVRASMNDLLSGRFSLSRMLAPWGLSFTQHNDSLMVDPHKVFPQFRSDEIHNMTAEAVRAKDTEYPPSCYVYNATRLYRRIFSFNYTTFYTPMDVIVPFLTPEGYGFLEAAIRWDNFSGNYVRMHRNIFDKHGAFALLSSGFVVVNSWGQKLLKEGHRPSLPIPADAVTSPLMKATLKLLDRYAADAESWKKQVRIYKFKFKGDLATARVFSFSHKGDQEFVFVTTALDKYTLNPIYEQKTKAVMVLASVFAAFTLLAYLAAGIVKEDLYKLKPFLNQCSTLQFASLPPIEPSLFLELQNIQSAFVALQRQLMTLKTYIPGPLLIMTSCSSNDNSETDDDTLGDSWTSGQESDTQPSDVDTVGESSPQVLLSFASNRWRRGYHLNTKIFKEKLNVFQRRYCTLLWLCRSYTNDVSNFDMNSLFRAAHVGSLTFNGCFEFMRPDYIVMSFGAHTPLLMHSSRACECASFIWNQLSPEDQSQVIVFVDTAEFLVGTCGVEGVRRSRVVFDINHLMELGSIFSVQNVNGVLATPTAVNQLTDYFCIPVARAHLSQTTTPYIVFEIRQIPPHACRDTVAQMRRRFRSAFHYMCEGKYGEAAQLYEQIGTTDRTAKRLLHVCTTYMAANRTDGYLLYSPHSCMQFFGYIFKSKYFRLFNIVAGLYTLQNFQLYMKQMTSIAAPPQLTEAGAPSARISTSAAAAAGTTSTTTSTAAAPPHSTITSEDVPASVPEPLSEPADASNSAGDFGREEDANRETEEEGVSETLEGSRSLVNENLMELLNVHSSTNSSTSEKEIMQEQSMSSIFGSIPAVIVDEDNRRWVRSRELIGKGAFAVAYKGMSEDGVQVAVKCMQVRRKRSHLTNLQSEIKMFAQLRHANIVQYISSKVTPQYVCIVMEYAPGGSLYDLLQIFGNFNPQTIKPFTQAILAGLSYLHSRGITHCDVKPHNMLLGVGGVCKLSDFGSAVQGDMLDQYGECSELELRGTAAYMAPEVAKGETCTAASDIFSLGVSLLELVTGRLPWVWSITAPPSRMYTLYQNSARFVQCLGRGEIRIDIPTSLDAEFAAFCKACCHTNPARRPNAQELMSFPYLL